MSGIDDVTIIYVTDITAKILDAISFMEFLCNFFNMCMKPYSWKNSIIVPPPPPKKGKITKMNAKITEVKFTEYAGNTFGRILIERIKKLTVNKIWKVQYGITLRKECTDLSVL